MVSQSKASERSNKTALWGFVAAFKPSFHCPVLFIFYQYMHINTVNNRSALNMIKYSFGCSVSAQFSVC